MIVDESVRLPVLVVEDNVEVVEIDDGGEVKR